MAEGENGGIVGNTPQIPMMKFKCGNENCGVEVAGRTPMANPFNTATVSGIVMSHERMVKCPKCGVAYICLVAGVGLIGNNDVVAVQMAWVPVQPQTQSGLVAPTQEQVNNVGKIKIN